MNGTQRRALVSLWRKHCMNSQWCPKRHLKLKQHQIAQKSSLYPYPLLSYACLKKSVSQVISQSIENSVKNFFLNSKATFWKRLGSNLKLFGLSFTNPILPRCHVRNCGWIYFVGVSTPTIFNIPTINHYCSSWYMYVSWTTIVGS